MKLKRIIIFYPSFERGGVETILLNLINFFLKKKIKIILISNVPKKKIPKVNHMVRKVFSIPGSGLRTPIVITLST